MTVVVHLVRHGAHDRLDKVLCGRMAGVCLGEVGRRQADAVAARLRNEPLSAVYSSPLERTQETARPIADAAGLAVTTDPRLSEIDFGEWTGASFEALQDDLRWRDWNGARSSASPPGGESMLQAQARVIGFVEEMIERHDGETVCAVSHSDIIKAALLFALGASLDHYGRLDVDSASLSTLYAGDWGLKVGSMNGCVQ